MIAVPVLLKVPVPRVVDPSLKVTLPVGVPDGAVTKAINRTVCPTVEGLGLLIKLVVVVAWLTT